MGLTEVLAAGKARLRGASSANEVPESPLPTSPRSLNRQAKLHRLLKQLHSQQADGTNPELPEGALAAGWLSKLITTSTGPITSKSWIRVFVVLTREPSAEPGAAAHQLTTLCK